MKYKKFKYKGYKGYNSKSVNKKALIIWISVAVAVLLIAAVAALLIANSIIVSENPDKDTGNIFENVFGGEETPVEDTIKSVQVAKYPDKRTYYCGDWFDKTGLKVYKFMQSGEFTEVNLDECTITGFDSSVPAESQTITVTYGEFSDTFTVTIKEKIKPIEVFVKSVAVETAPKTEYKLGDWLETTGGKLTVTYTDDTTKTVDLEPGHVSGFKAAMRIGVGEHDLMVIYVENGVQATTTYKITISE